MPLARDACYDDNLTLPDSTPRNFNLPQLLDRLDAALQTAQHESQLFIQDLQQEPPFLDTTTTTLAGTRSQVSHWQRRSDLLARELSHLLTCLESVRRSWPKFGSSAAGIGAGSISAELAADRLASLERENRDLRLQLAESKNSLATLETLLEEDTHRFGLQERESLLLRQQLGLQAEELLQKCQLLERSQQEAEQRGRDQEQLDLRVQRLELQLDEAERDRDQLIFRLHHLEHHQHHSLEELDCFQLKEEDMLNTIELLESQTEQLNDRCSRLSGENAELKSEMALFKTQQPRFAAPNLTGAVPLPPPGSTTNTDPQPSLSEGDLVQIHHSSKLQATRGGKPDPSVIHEDELQQFHNGGRQSGSADSAIYSQNSNDFAARPLSQHTRALPANSEEEDPSRNNNNSNTAQLSYLTKLVDELKSQLARTSEERSQKDAEVGNLQGLLAPIQKQPQTEITDGGAFVASLAATGGTESNLMLGRDREMQQLREENIAQRLELKHTLEQLSFIRKAYFKLFPGEHRRLQVDDLSEDGFE